MQKLSHDDGSWAELLQQWSDVCHHLGEDFQSFAPETIEHLSELVESTEEAVWDGVYGIKEDRKFVATCFVNGARIPGFTGRVLRVRHILLSPESDFAEYNEEWHGKVLGSVFERIIELSDSALPCPHVKFHFRSPADLALFRRVKDELLRSDHFSNVNIIGAWLLLTKS